MIEHPPFTQLRLLIPLSVCVAPILGVGLIMTLSPANAFTANMCLTPIAGFVNWIVTAAVWVRTDPKGRRWDDSNALLFAGIVVGFLAGLTTSAAMIAITVASALRGNTILGC